MKFAGLKISVEKNAIYAFCVMVVVLCIVTVLIGLVTEDISDMAFAEVLLVAFAAATFHFFAQFVHMLGHALAAWLIGYPKSGMVFLYIFAMSSYPPDEPPLPDRVHIQRSLGGVVAFGLVLLVVLMLWITIRDYPQWSVRYLTTYMLLDTALLFAVSALVSDGVLFILNKEWRTQPAEDGTLL